MSNLGVSIEANLDNLNNGISAAISKVQGFGKAVEGLPAPKLPTPQFNGAEISKVLDGLDAKLRVAQGNVELFGNQFQGDKLKILAYQQALNQLLAQGISPTSKEVLNLANNIELLGKKTERQQAILDRQASKAAQAFKPQEGILQNLQRNIDLYRQKMLRATDTKSIENYRQTIQSLEAQVRKLGSTGPQAINQVSVAANRLSGSANGVSMEFARIIQDAPYGMMGIGNNIQQLTANFGQLQRSAGSTKAALGAALSSLVTPASLLTLGVAALTSGWAAYQMWQQKSAKSTRETAAELRKSKDSVDDYIKSLEGVRQARLNGEREAQKELTTLRLLYKQTQNTTASTQERQKAVDELQKQYPAYFKNFKDEEILAGKAAGAYDKLSSSILATAKARAAQDLIAEKARQQLVNEQKIADLAREEIQTGLARQRQAETLAKVQERLRKNGDNSQANAQALLLARTEEEINKLVAERKSLLAENLKLGKEMQALEGTASLDLTTSSNAKETAKETVSALETLRLGFNQATKEAIVFGSSFDEMGVKAGLFKTAINALMEQGMNPNDALIKDLKSSYDLFSSTTLPTAGNAIQTFIKQDLNALQDALQKAGAQPLPPMVIPKVLAPDYGDAKAAFEEYVDYTAMIAGALTSTFALVGETIAASLAGGTGGFSSFFDGILLIVADFAQAFGSALIAAGFASEAFKQLISNPYLAIAAGGALIAAAGVVKGIISAGPKGGGSMAPSVSGVGGGYSNPRVGTSFGSGPDEVVFEIHGDTLRGVLDRNAYKRNRIGG